MGTGFPNLHPHSNSGFFETSVFIRFITLFCASAGLFLFLALKEISPPLPDVGMKATQSVIAAIPFSAVDTLATEAAFAAHSNEVGRLYKITKEGISKREQEVATALVHNPQWRQLRPSTAYDDIADTVPILATVLAQIRFGSAMAINEYREFSQQPGLYFEIGHLDPVEGICFTDTMIRQIQEELIHKHHVNSQIANYLADGLQEKIWFLVEADRMTKWRKWERDHFPPRYQRYPAGTVIVQAKEIITPEHRLKLEGLRNALEEQSRENIVNTVAGSALLTSIIITVCLLFFRCYSPQVLQSNSISMMIGTIALLTLAISKGYELIAMHFPDLMNNGLLSPILVPGMGVLLCILVDPFVALFMTALFVALMDSFLSLDAPHFLLINLIVSFVCIFYARSLRRRAEIVVVCSKGYLVAAALLFSFYIFNPVGELPDLCYSLGFTALFMLATTVAIIGLLPILESLFHVLTDINLMEYMNPNNPLLRRLMTEAPGTSQHSLLLGSLAEAAATAIGCDGLFCRVATLYHDVGKVCIAQYFSENQDSGRNIHQLLTPKESARIIVSHVQEGVNLARREGLPEPFISIIKEHHGTGLVYYFYHKQLEAMGNDPKNISEKDFRYLGPKPHSKEACIVMIADSFEAACRSIDDISEPSLMKLIDQIVREKMEDGQFDECPMSFEELCKVKRALVKCIISIGHFRIKYPAKKRTDLEIC